MKNVLLVDDDPVIEILVRKIVEKIPNLNFLYAKNAFEADSVLGDFKIDLMLMDINMPGKDGLVYTFQLKVNPKTQNIPIIMFTCSDSDCDMSTAKLLGAVEFLRKELTGHVAFEALRTKMEKYLK